jgi:lipopolysaccharide export system permease protein
MAVLVIVLFGLPLTTNNRRGGGTAFGIGMSLAITMGYLMLFKVGEAMGESGAISPLLAAWTPNILFFLAALAFLWRVRT